MSSVISHQVGPSVWHVLGAGAIGSLFARYLQQAGHKAIILTRRHRPSSIDILEDARTHQCSFQTECLLRHDENDKITNLLVTVKAHHTSAALASVANRLTSDTTVAFLQNGMGQHEGLHHAGKKIFGTTTEGVYRITDSKFRHAGIGSTLWNRDTPPNCALSQLPRSSILMSEDDFQRIVAAKLSANCAINGLTALLRKPNGYLLRPDLFNIVSHVFDESCRVLGLQIDAKPLKSILKKSELNYSSMLQDILRGQETEIDFMNGYVTREGAKRGEKTPLNQCLRDMVVDLSRRQTLGRMNDEKTIVSMVLDSVKRAEMHGRGA